MAEKITEIKGAIALVMGAVSAALGWFGWLVVLYVACMTMDWITGSMAACRNRQWESAKARDGIWHKFGSIFAVLVSGGADFLIGLMINNLPNIQLPFTYGVLFCPVVIVWYIIAEMGSIVENASKLGAPVPKFLRYMLVRMHDVVDSAGEVLTEEKGK